MTIFGRRQRESLRQARLVAAVLAVREVRRLAAEAGVPTVGRRWLVLVVAALLALVLALAWLVGAVAVAILTSTGRSLAGALGVLVLVAGAAPWLVGTMGAAPAVSSHLDRAHTLIRPALSGVLVPVLARMAVPAAVKSVLAVVVVTVASVPLLSTTGVRPWTTVLLALVGIAYAGAVTVVRVALLGVRLRLVAVLRRGRLGLPFVGVVVLAQCAAAFALPHLLARMGERPEIGSLLEAWGRRAGAVSPTAALVALVVLVVVAVVLTPPAFTALAGGLDLVSGELRQTAAHLRQSAAVAPPLPPDPVKALVVKDVRRARRSGGPIIGPSIATTAWGCVMASGLLGLSSSGLLPGRDNPLLLGFQLLVSALLALEFASLGLRPITSPDADGAAARVVLSAPDGRRRSVRAKAGLHAGILSVVAVATLGLLVLVVDISVGGSLALVTLVVGGIVLSTLEHVGAPAAHPRLDWTTLEQIGGNPKAQALGFTVSVIGFTLLNTLSTSMVALDVELPLRVLVLGALVLVAAAVSPPLARAATTVFLRRFS